MSLYQQSAPPLAVKAAQGALAESGFSPESITHLIVVTCTGFIAPGVDYAIIRGLNLSSTVERIQVGYMGCHGALNGLKVANALATADPNARILLVAVELCSLHYYIGEEPGKIVANALFADGAAALIGTGGETPEPGWRVTATGSCLIPNSAKDMGWTIGDHGFEMTLSKRIPDLIQQHLRPWMDRWLGSRGRSVESIRSWAIHPGGPKIVAGAQAALGLSDADLGPSLGVLADYGNMSSPTVLFILNRLMAANAPRPCVMLGFGPGLVAEAALWE
jgi:predicted naringenin-chalcone synthase